MDFYYGKRAYKTAKTLEWIEYVLRIIEDGGFSGCLSSIVLTGSALNIDGKSRSTITTALKNTLEGLDIISVSRKGKYGRRRYNGQQLQECNNYYIDKFSLVLTYLFCKYLDQLDNKTINAIHREKTHVTLDYVKVGLEARRLGGNPLWRPPRRTPLTINVETESKLHNKILNGFLAYYYIYIHSCIDIVYQGSFLRPIETLSRTVFWLRTVDETTLAGIDGMCYACMTSLEHRANHYEKTAIPSTSTQSPNDKRSDTGTNEQQPITDNSHVKGFNPHRNIPDIPPLITYGLFNAVPEPLPLVWFTDEKNEGLLGKNDLAQVIRNAAYEVSNLMLSQDAYKSDESLTRQFSPSTVDLITFYPSKIDSRTVLTQEGLEALKYDFARYVVRNSPWLITIHEQLRANSLDLAKGFHFKVNVRTKRGKPRKDGSIKYTIWVSGRQHNPMAQAPSKAREKIAGTELQEIDLHSAVFNIARMINNIPFNNEANIKDDIVAAGFLDSDGNPVTSAGIKRVLYRCCFSISKRDATAKYERSIKLGNEDRYLSKETFEAVYDFCQRWTGGTEKICYALFILESILELRVMNHLCVLYPQAVIENTYDCFYYSGEGLDQDTVERTIKKEADWVLTECQRLLGRA